MVAAMGGLAGFLGVIGARLLGMLLQILVSRIYGPRVFGLFVTGVIICFTMQLISVLGLPKGGMRFLAIAFERKDYKAMPNIFRVSTVIPLAAGAMVGGALYFVAPLLAINCFNDSELTDVLRGFSFAVPFLSLLRIGSELSRAFKVTKYGVIIEDLLFSALQILFFLLLYGLGFGPLAVVSAFTISAAICSVLMILITWRLLLSFLTPLEVEQPKGRRSILPRECRPILAYSAPLMPMGLLIMGDPLLNIMMLGIMTDASVVGEYAAADKWLMFFIFISRPLFMIFTPLMVGQLGKDRHAQLKGLYRASTRWTFFMILPGLIFILLAREPLMTAFGDAFTRSAPTVLAIVIFGGALTALIGSASNLLMVSGHQYEELFCLIGGLLAHFLLNIWLIPLYGIFGAGFATLAGSIVSNMARVLLVYKYFKMQPFTIHFGFPAVTSLIVCMAGLFAGYVMHLSMLSHLAIGTLGACAVLLCILAGGLHQEDRELFQMVWAKFGRRKHAEGRRCC
jgi:O-antigen/teichoic acid export membrane protein